MGALLDRVQMVFRDGDGDVPDLGIEDPAAAGTEQPAGGEPAELDPDPEPGRRTRRRARASKATAAKQTRAGGKFVSKATVQKQMTQELEELVKFLALTWSVTDEHCAGVLNATSANIARDYAALMARSEWLTSSWDQGSFVKDVIRALMSTLPLVRAMWMHHGPGRPAELEEEHDAVTVDPDRFQPYRPAYSG